VSEEETEIFKSSTSNCLCGFLAVFVFTIRNHRFYKCSFCNLIFVSPRFDASSIYNSDYFSGGTHGFGFSNYESDKIASKSYLEKYLDSLIRLPHPGPKTLIDIGAANGFFVSLADKRGFKSVGLEISAQAVEWAQKLNRPVVKGTIEAFSSEQKFGFATALDVLEHVENPQEFLASINRVLVPGGYLLVNVPNAGSLTAKLSGKKWHAFLPPEHWFFFDRKSLQVLLESHGFKVIQVNEISKSFSCIYVYLTILNSPQVPGFLKWALSKSGWLFRTRLGKVKIYLPLFDNLSIIAVKQH